MPTTVTDYDLTPTWIDPSWLFWEFRTGSGAYLSRDTAERAYEIHQHACDRLVGDPGEFDRVDAITALRRAVAQRVRVLKEAYELRKLPIHPKPKGDLEFLSDLEIIRPFMLKRLIDIRNIVEHQDSSPPSLDDCLMFADLVWYFLRTTDVLTYLKVNTLIFEPPGASDSSEQPYPSIELYFHNLSEPPQFRMWLNSLAFTHKPNADWMTVQPTKIEGFKEEDEVEASRFIIHGAIRGTGQQMMQVYRLYFRTSYRS